MPYYVVGDYYGRGDYYRGDGIFSAIGRGLKVVAGGLIGGAIGLAKGGPVGAAKGVITGVVSTVPGVVREGIRDETLAAGADPTKDAANRMLIERNRALVAAGAAGPMLMPPTTFGGRPLMLPSGQVVMVRKRRRMNVANSRALRRALRRTQGFAKLARRFLVVNRHYKKVGRRKRR